MPPMSRARRDSIVVGVIALVVRIPAFFAPQPLGFDDGQFAASVLAMRNGGLPFTQVFSSQGPLFLPIVWLGDLLTFRTIDSPRAASVIAGVALAVLALHIGRRLTTPGAAQFGAVLVALSGSVLWTTGPLTSDGIGEALTAATVLSALVYWTRPSTRRAIAIGILAGAALAVKSLLVIPGLAAAGFWILLRRRGRDLAIIPLVGVATLLAASVPWGLGRVYDQYVRYHTDAVADRPIAANASKLARTLFERDAPLVVATLIVALAVGAAWFARRRSPNPAASDPADPQANPASAPAFPVAVWLVATIGVVLTESPMWRNHVAHVAVPLAILVAVGAGATKRLVPVAAACAILI
ncbi:MAG: glycosyltransferase family 39 protein, partial [Acidimicrobiia bacterium]|nr:glycosyltransferase family 39 protein [Acidimicrobiia bacterium]